ncbi:MAG: ABC transporter permease [Anaerolineae bacterium]|nr:ABC transporter permease [Anaerolineae bacterium]
MTHAKARRKSIQANRALIRVANFLSNSGLLIAVMLLFVYLSLEAPNFLSSRNLLNVLRAVAINGIIACGMTLVIISGDIDVSVGSAVAWSSSLLGVLAIDEGWPLELAVVAVLVQGTLIHALAGFIRTRWQIPAFVLTLTLFISLRGAARYITNAFPVTPFPDSFNYWGGGYVAEGIPLLERGIPIPVIIMLIAFVIFFFITTRTTFGRSVYAIGGNEEAARLSGISVMRTRVMTFAIIGFLSAFCGVLISSRIMSGSSNIAEGLEFEVIAAVIIGGTSLMGGKGSIWGTFLGVLFIGLLSNGMVLQGISPFVQEIVRGLIILVAVFISTLQRSLQRA